MLLYSEDFPLIRSERDGGVPGSDSKPALFLRKNLQIASGFV